jgi:phosphate transport system substrate-binding protein
MPLRLLFCLLGILFGLPSAAFARDSISVRGSDTMVILNQRWAERFMQENPGITIQVTGGGSGTGIAALINGTVDMAASSRPIRDKEREMIRERTGRDVLEIAVARDGVVMYVNADNPIESLTVEQIKAIYTGRITRWSAFGLPARRIIVYSRENNSGTYIFFRDNVLGGADFFDYTMTLPGTGAVVNAVTKDRNGIGYGGAAYGRGIRPIAIAGADGVPVAPTAANIASDRYPLARPLYFYIAREPNASMERFLNWILAPEGQQVVEDVGYFPLQVEHPAL